MATRLAQPIRTVILINELAESLETICQLKQRTGFTNERVPPDAVVIGSAGDDLRRSEDLRRLSIEERRVRSWTAALLDPPHRSILRRIGVEPITLRDQILDCLDPRRGLDRLALDPDMEVQALHRAVATLRRLGGLVDESGEGNGGPRRTDDDDGGATQAPTPVELRGKDQDPIVRGKTKKRLTAAQYDVVDALVDAGEDGLSKDDLDRKSRHGDARKILGRLRRDSDWAGVVQMAGITGGRYRIVQSAHQSPPTPT